MKGGAGDEEALWRSPRKKSKNREEAKADARLRKFAKNADEGRCYTLHEIAEAMGVTRERVRQIQQKALMKLYKRFTQIFKTEDMTPEEAMEVFRGHTGGFEHDVMEARSDET